MNASGPSEYRKRIYLSPPHMGDDELRLVGEAFASNWITSLGPQVTAFEDEFRKYVGTRGALALGSGTAGVHLALLLLGVRPGDTVICSSLTFIGSANPILYVGAEPVFVDSDRETWNMSPQALERALDSLKRENRLPKAAIIVNLYGQSADWEKLLPICERYGVPVLEDAAESLGATYRGRSTGVYGKLGLFSFNGNKIITTSGGGMLVSDDLKALEKARFLATQARDPSPHYQHSEMGFNYRLSNILAAIGLGQLRVLDSRVEAKRSVFDRYRQALGGIAGVEFMPEADFGRSTRWLTTLTLDPRAIRTRPIAIINALEAEQIEARPVWKPLHLQPLFGGRRYFAHGSGGESVSDSLFEHGICLPSGSALSAVDQERIIGIVQRELRRP